MLDSSSRTEMAEIIPCLDSLIKQATEVYQKKFKDEPNVAVFAPGRVNLIGEHTDYNDGFVMPMALPLVTVMVGKKICGNTSTVFSNAKIDIDHSVVFEMSNLESGEPKWANYIKGVVANYKGCAGPPPAFQAAIANSVPIGGGLSSSASLEVAMYMFLDAITNTDCTPDVEKALACQKAEHDFAGMPCGIMDQFISIMGKQDNALLIDCRSMTSTLIPLDKPDIVILITNSNVKHKLTGSEYPTRRKQCEEAAKLLKVTSLRDSKADDIQRLESLGAKPDVVKRAKHVIYEIERTAHGAELLKAGKYSEFGKLMYASHYSLKNDYDVSCTEIDQLVELASQVDGVIGSRMTGGGFGGCTVTMVHSNAVENLIQHISKNYTTQKPTFFICKPSNGAKIITK